jgi:hypothetical protein
MLSHRARVAQTGLRGAGTNRGRGDLEAHSACAQGICRCSMRLLNLVNSGGAVQWKK